MPLSQAFLDPEDCKRTAPLLATSFDGGLSDLIIPFLSPRAYSSISQTSSLHILLSTTIGERVMQPRYGCNLKQFLFEPLNESVQFRMKKVVEDAILYFEPRTAEPNRPVFGS